MIRVHCTWYSTDSMQGLRSRGNDRERLLFCWRFMHVTVSEVVTNTIYWVKSMSESVQLLVSFHGGILRNTRI